MLDFSRVQNYYTACGYTGMRKQIDGLVAVVELQFGRKLDEASIFLFCRRYEIGSTALCCEVQIIERSEMSKTPSNSSAIEAVKES